MINNIVYVGKHSITKIVSRHTHSSWEIIYCTSGTGRLVFENCTLNYRENDIVVIPPRLPHENISQEGFTNYHIHMENLALATPQPFILSERDNEQMLSTFSAAFYYNSAHSEASKALLPAFGHLIATYVSIYQKDGMKNETAQMIERQIILHCTDSNFDLAEYLKSLPFSCDYLTKSFKKEMNTTPHQYLTDLRLRTAMDWLRTAPENNISEIAHICGFKDPLYFSRMFRKKYGCSPSFFRQRPDENKP